MTRLGSVVIVGAGQVGTMVGIALMEADPAAGVSSVGLYDSDPGIARAAVARGGGDTALVDPELVLAAQLVVLAIPVDQIVRWLEDYGPRLQPGAVVIDTGSAKALVVQAMAQFIPSGVHAIGGHPMAGNEDSGPGAAEPGALRDALFVFTPFRPDPRALEVATALAIGCGSRPLVVEADTHDRVVARTSHLPHLLASALAAAAAAAGDDLPLARALAGTGYQSTCRLATSDSRMVAAFVAANRREVLAALGEFRSELARLESALAMGPAALEAVLQSGRAGRALLLGPD